MSLTLYDFGGLRFWTEREILSRERIVAQIADTIQRTLRGVNQAWAFERVDTPLIIPRSALNPAYTGDDAFFLEAEMGGEQMVMRAETTDGSYRVAEHLLRAGKVRLPLGVWQLGQSFRRELGDGANAANLRFNSFYQLEFQLLYAKPVLKEMSDEEIAEGKAKLERDNASRPEDQRKEWAHPVIRGTAAPIPKLVKEALLTLVQKITGLDARIVPSDRLPPYSEVTEDIEVFWHPPTKAEPEWKEVCSMSQRKDFTAQIPGIKDEITVFEIAFGADRMVAVTQGEP